MHPQDFAFGLASFAAKSTLVLVAATLACLVCRRLGSSYRHLVLAAGFCAILALPVLELVVPRQGIVMLPPGESVARDRLSLPPVLAPETAIGARRTPTSESSAVGGGSSQGLERGARKSAPASTLGPKSDLSTTIPRGSRSARPLGNVMGGALTVKHENRLVGLGIGGREPAATLGWSAGFTPEAFYLGVLAIWAIGTIACLGGQIVSLWLLAASTSRAAERDKREFSDLAIRAGVSRDWRLFFQDVAGTAAPKTWGVLNPIVAMPPASMDWPRDQFETVLMHELVHVQRLDCLTQSLAMVGCALNWFNPLAWLCLRALRTEAENATDDAVLLAGVKPSDYAEALLQAARDSHSNRRYLISAGVPLMKQSKIETRIRTILSPMRRGRQVSRLGVFTTLGATLLVAAPCAALQAMPAPVAPVPPVPAAQASMPAPAAPDVSPPPPVHLRIRSGVSGAYAVVEPPPAAAPAAPLAIQAPPAKKGHVPPRTAKHSPNRSQFADKQMQAALATIAELQAKLAQKQIALARTQALLDAEMARQRGHSGTAHPSMPSTQEAQARANAAIARVRAEQAAVWAAQRYLSDVQSQFRAGIVSSVQVDEAKVQLMEVEAAMATAQADVIASRDELAAETNSSSRQTKRTGAHGAEAQLEASLNYLMAQLDEAKAEFAKQQALQQQGFLVGGSLDREIANINALQAQVTELKIRIGVLRGASSKG
jgi:hypothetical protein